MTDSRPTVIVVDDDAQMGHAIGRLLTQAGFRARIFESGETLLADDAAASADCLILDIQLPGISGFELRQAMMQRGISPPVIYITALDDPAVGARAKSTGAAAFFTKPFHAKPLLAAIAGALSKA